MTPQDKMFFAVRESDKHEWIDINTWGYVEVTSQEKAKVTDLEIPHWAKDNPVIRYSQFRLTEI